MELQRQSLSAIEAGWRMEWPSCRSTVYGSRLVVVSAGNVLAEAVLQQVPDETLSILFTKCLADSSPRAVEMILVAAGETVSELRLRYGYIFVPSDTDNWVKRCLTAAGFRAIDSIQEFRCDSKSLALTVSTEVAFWHGVPDSEEVARPFSQNALGALIANVIEESADLQQLPLPTAQQLQMLWQVLNADVQLTVAVLGQRPIGLAVLSRSGQAPDEAVIVEYFGTHSDFRRRGIGRNLLVSAAMSIRTEGSRWVTSFVAEGNTVAQSFFRSQRFEPRAAQQLWASR